MPVYRLLSDPKTKKAPGFEPWGLFGIGADLLLARAIPRGPVTTGLHSGGNCVDAKQHARKLLARLRRVKFKQLLHAITWLRDRSRRRSDLGQWRKIEAERARWDLAGARMDLWDAALVDDPYFLRSGGQIRRRLFRHFDARIRRRR